MSTPPTYPFPPGTPSSVPENFDLEAMQRELAELRSQQGGQLSADEVAEFRQLREDKKANDARVAQEAEEAASRLQPARHYVQLADGHIVDGSTIETHVDYGDGLVHATAAYPKPEFVTFPPDGS